MGETYFPAPVYTAGPSVHGPPCKRPLDDDVGNQIIMSWLTRKISRRLSDAAVEPFASEELTLEVGAYGRPSYGRFFPNRVGIDIKEGPGVDRIASVYELPFPDGHFANVLCMSVLEHLQDPPGAIREMRRVLKPGGRMILSVPFIFPIHDAPGDYWRFTKFGLRHLFAAGWNIKTLVAEATPQQSLAIVLQRLSYQSTMRANGPMKFMLLISARLLAAMPNMFIRVFGDIQKKVIEPDAFASSFFLVAEKA